METEQRPIVVLLRIMREWCEENFEKRVCCGLCEATALAARDEAISWAEMDVLRDYISRNMPDFYHDNGVKSLFGWPQRQLQPRLEWLDAEIERLEKEQQNTAEK